MLFRLWDTSRCCAREIFPLPHVLLTKNNIVWGKEGDESLVQSKKVQSVPGLLATIVAVELVVFGERSREICLKTCSTSPSSSLITLSLLKRISSNGLCPRNLRAPSAYCLKLFNTLYLVVSPTLMMVGIPGVITQFFRISLNLCHRLKMPHYMLIFLLFNLCFRILEIL